MAWHWSGVVWHWSGVAWHWSGVAWHWSGGSDDARRADVVPQDRLANEQDSAARLKQQIERAFRGGRAEYDGYEATMLIGSPNRVLAGGME